MGHVLVPWVVVALIGLVVAVNVAVMTLANAALILATMM